MQQIKDISKVNWFEKLIVLLALITMIFILYNISKFQLDKIKQKEIIKLDSLTNYYNLKYDSLEKELNIINKQSDSLVNVILLNKKKYGQKINNIKYLSVDSNINILSTELSQETINRD